jgi:hypothetical protein
MARCGNLRVRLKMYKTTKGILNEKITIGLGCDGFF